MYKIFNNHFVTQEQMVVYYSVQLVHYPLQEAQFQYLLRLYQCLQQYYLGLSLYMLSSVDVCPAHN